MESNRRKNFSNRLGAQPGIALRLSTLIIRFRPGQSSIKTELGDMPDIGSLEPSLFAVKRGRKWVFRAVCPPRRNVRHCHHAGRARQGILRRVTSTQIDVWATLHFREAGTSLTAE